MKRLMVWVMVVTLFGLVSFMAWTYREFNWLVWRNIDLLLLLIAAPMVAYITCVAKLMKRFTWTHWWIGDPFGKFNPPSDNIVEEPLKLRWLWGPYAAVLLFSLPAYACAEEWVFRQTVVYDLKTAVIWSIVFGLVHMLMLVRLHTAIALSFAGFIFSCVYLGYGIGAAVLLHTAFNIWGVTVGVIELRVKYYKEARELQAA